jgi:hypothetical protein
MTQPLAEPLSFGFRHCLHHGLHFVPQKLLVGFQPLEPLEEPHVAVNQLAVGHQAAPILAPRASITSSKLVWQRFGVAQIGHGEPFGESAKNGRRASTPSEGRGSYFKSTP